MRNDGFVLSIGPCTRPRDELKPELSLALSALVGEEEGALIRTIRRLMRDDPAGRFEEMAGRLIDVRNSRSRIDPVVFAEREIILPDEEPVPYGEIRSIACTRSLYLFKWRERFVFFEKKGLQGGTEEEFEQFLHEKTAVPFHHVTGR